MALRAACSGLQIQDYKQTNGAATLRPAYAEPRRILDIQVRGLCTVLHKGGEPASARLLALVLFPGIEDDLVHCRSSGITRHVIASDSL